MADCAWVPDGEHYRRCTACGRRIDPHVFDLSSAGPCRAWSVATTETVQPQRMMTAPPRSMQAPPPRNMAVIATYYNFAGWRALRENYLRFLHDMEYWGVPLFVAELAIDDQPFERNQFLQIRASSDRHLLWQKEPLLNRLVAELPERFDAVAWIDADMTFLDRHWYPRTLAALAEYPVVQMWDEWHFTDHQGKVSLIGQSVGHRGERFRRNMGHPGGAWAARRSVFPLHCSHVLGGGDTVAVEGWLGLRDTFLQRQMTPVWLANYSAWADDAWGKVQGQMTTLPGDCLHHYHGTRENRRYGDRSRWLMQHQFDPTRHITTDEQGLLAWTDEAPPALLHLVHDYFFAARNEDEGLYHG